LDRHHGSPGAYLTRFDPQSEEIAGIGNSMI